MRSVKSCIGIAAIILSSILLFPDILLHAQEKSEAVLYIETFTKELNTIQIEMWEYVRDAVHIKDSSATERKRKSLMKLIEKTIARVEKIEPYNGEAIYKAAVVKYLKILEIMMKEEYSKIIDMEEIAEQSYDSMEAYLLAKEKANQKFQEIIKEFNLKEKQYAVANNIILIENESDITKKLNKADEVTDYYNTIYLIFFKSFKQELYLLDAIEKGDVGKMEQNRLVLIKFANEGMNKLGSIKMYDKDDSIKKSCLDMLKFYKVEATEKIKIISDYYIQKDMFEKMKDAFDLKKAEERTREDVDLYNDTVNKANEASKKANNTIDSLNSERSNLIDEWNKNISVFFDVHVPK